ncbi:MAG: phosphoenolpyruvate--protein phosphotransferase [Lentisphaerae bacterium]|nr:phosphoenolpyruvate--protein phosphotransferase [Lentisphaerota bacterium]
MELTENLTNSFQGIAVSPGIGIGRVMKIAGPGNAAPERLEIPESSINAEIERLHTAIAATAEQLSSLQSELRRKLNNLDADIFEFHIMLVRDRTLITAIENNIRSGKCNCEYALYEALEHFQKVFSTIPDEYLRERSLDLRDVGARLMENLTDVNAVMQGLDDHRVIVAASLTPTETARLDTSRVLGFVLENGSVTSHTAILARSLNLPAVVGIPGADLANLSGADKLIIDGFSGRVIVNPDSRTEEAYRLKARAADEFHARMQADNALPSETVDGFSIPLAVNLDSACCDLSSVKSTGASGIGLVRTEFMFLNPHHLPTEEEQFEVYKKLLIEAGDLPVVIRTMDIGGDKIAAGISTVAEENPFLGLRGIRLALRERVDLFKTQLRALLRAGVYGNLHIMLPMISSISEVWETRSIIDKLCSEMAEKGIEHVRELPLGVMIETPGAALIAGELSRICDFFSIGTNDLVQYTRAIDRGNEHVAYLYRPAHPSVLKLIKQTVEGAREGGIPVSVCGQMAADPALAVLLVGLGVHELSMVDSALPIVRRAIRSVSMYDAVQAAEKALACGRAAEVEEIVAGVLRERFPELAEI